MAGPAIEIPKPVTVSAVDLGDALAGLRPFAPAAVSLGISGHTTIATHASTIATALRELVTFWGRESYAIFNGAAKAGSFVQVWRRATLGSVYGEAIDKDAYGRGHLEPAQREMLAQFGWHDVKLSGYAPAGYQWLWAMNYSREWPLEIPRIAADLAECLHEAYAVFPHEDLQLHCRRVASPPTARRLEAQPAFAPVAAKAVAIRHTR